MSRADLTAEQELLLEAVTTGDLSLDHPSIAAARADARFADQLDALIAVQRELDVARTAGSPDAADSVDHAAIAAEPEPFPGADPLVRQQVLRLGAAERRRRSFARLATAAAAAVIVLGLGLWWLNRGDDQVRRDQWLRGGSILCEHPAKSEPGQSFATFRGRSKLPPRGWFEITIFDKKGSKTVLASVEQWQQSSWSPTVTLPDSIYWQVVAFDQSGMEVARGWAEASR